jgi:hypothetical protein
VSDDDSGLLTRAVTTWPPRLTHAIARLLGWRAALAMFCGGECCPSCGVFGDEDDDAVEETA